LLKYRRQELTSKDSKLDSEEEEREKLIIMPEKT
jgi:hypothetical protein